MNSKWNQTASDVQVASCVFDDSNPRIVTQREAFSYQRIERLIQSIGDRSPRPGDSYIWSPGYYAFTGRLGAEIFTDHGKAACVVVRHPNVSDCVVVFPPISSDPAVMSCLLMDVVLHYRSSGMKIRLGRLDHSTVEIVHTLRRFNIDFEVFPVQEDVLDWQFPVHILDTQKVIHKKGAGFERLRQRLRKLRRDEFEVETLAPSAIPYELNGFLDRWAVTLNQNGNYSLEDLTRPSQTLFELFSSHPERLRVQVLRVGKSIVSFVIWELPIFQDMPANQLATASNHAIQGLSEWQIVTMCEELWKLGVSQVNIGGSESIGLDRYKRKFSPVISKVLCSMSVKYRLTEGVC